MHDAMRGQVGKPGPYDAEKKHHRISYKQKINCICNHNLSPKETF